MENTNLKRKNLKSKIIILLSMFMFAMAALFLSPSSITAWAASGTTIDVYYNGTTYTLDVALTDNVGNLETNVATKTSVAVASQKLYFGNYYIGEQTDTVSLSTLGIVGGSTVYLLSNNWTNTVTTAPAGFVKDDTAKTVTISSAEGMAWLASVVNGLNGQTATTLSDYTVSLTADIDLSRHFWTSIGSSITNYFSGTFNGNGHTIKGLYLNSTIDNQGLFGYISSAIIKDVSVGGYVYSSVTNVGGIAGWVAGTCEINNCSNAATVKSADFNAGGIVAAAQASSTVKIYNCYNTGTIKAGTSSAGGIVGLANGAVVNIYNCYNTGAITVSVNNAGGIIAAAQASSTVKIYNCYNTGTMTASENRASGIISHISSSTAEICNCYNSGALTSVYSSGGIVGYCYSSTVSIINCYNKGITSATNGAGGIVGTKNTNNVSLIIKSCYFLNITASSLIGANYDGTNWTPGTGNTTTGNAIIGDCVGLYSALMTGVASYSATYPNMTIWFNDYTIPVNDEYPVLHNTFSTNMVTSLPATGYIQNDTAKTVTISNSKGLAWLASVVNGVNGQTANNFSGYTITLTADVDLVDYNWMAIGTSDTPFSGTFDGGGHTINNLYINVWSDNQGLFGYVSSATIKNVAIGSGYIYTGTGAAGGIAGYSTGTSKINNCSNASTVKASYYAGGMIGYITGTVINICNCYNTGSITTDKGLAGGIVGRIDSFSSIVNIDNCHNSG